jgi:hypothetical protein
MRPIPQSWIAWRVNAKITARVFFQLRVPHSFHGHALYAFLARNLYCQSVPQTKRRPLGEYLRINAVVFTNREIHMNDSRIPGNLVISLNGSVLTFRNAGLEPVTMPGDYSPRPVRIIFHPSWSRFSTSALPIAVMPQATL